MIYMLKISRMIKGVKKLKGKKRKYAFVSTITMMVETNDLSNIEDFIESEYPQFKNATIQVAEIPEHIEPVFIEPPHCKRHGIKQIKLN